MSRTPGTRLRDRWPVPGPRPRDRGDDRWPVPRARLRDRGDDRPPVPSSRIATGAAVPGWLVRPAVGLAVLAAGAVTLDVPQLLVAAVLAVVVTALPNPYLLGLAAGWMALAQLLGTPGGLGWQGAATLLAVHLLMVAGGLAAATGWRGRVEVALLASLGRRFVVVQLLAQVLGLTGALVLGAVVPLWLSVTAVLALAASGWVVLGGMRAHSPPVRHP